jgi:uncharacterized membrane-anchored protein
MGMKRWWTLLMWLMMMSLSTATAVAGKSKTAEVPASEAVAPGAAEASAAEAAAQGDAVAAIPHVVGPKDVSLGHHARIALPTGMRLLAEAEAQALMRKVGNDPEGVIAAIFPPPGAASWVVIIEAQDVGYVSDDDADELDASALLQSFRSGTEEQNKQRVKQGVSALTIDGWSEAPRYDRVRHHLVWGLNAHDPDGKVVNFFTRFLGRYGYLSVDLIDSPDTLMASKVQAQAVLNALSFEPGAAYGDHASEDHSSGMGLTALVLGGTGVVLAKKGILVALLLAFKKGFVVIFLAIGAFFKRWFGRKSSNDAVPKVSGAGGDSGPPPV